MKRRIFLGQVWGLGLLLCVGGWLVAPPAHADLAPFRGKRKRRAKRAGWMPTKLPSAQRKIMYGTAEDKLSKPVCTGGRRVTLQCRDKQHYLTTNEFHHELFYPYLINRGGAYAGVGTDQNFTFISWARSRIAFLMDYDPVVVRINLAHRAFILTSPNRRGYLKYWKPRNKKRGARLLRKFYKNHPEREGIVEAYFYARKTINFHYHIIRKRRFGWNYHRMRPAPKRKNLRDKRDFNWMHKESNYRYIRRMFQTGRIRIMRGDLLLASSLRGIGNACRKMGIPLRLLYMSNAEEFWKYPENFRKNIRNLPMDKKSLVIRTRFTSKYGSRLDAWIYILHKGLHFQKMVKKASVKKVDDSMKPLKKVVRGLFTIKVPLPPGAMRHLRTP
ncbi:MAG: hypothetical protein EP343_13295 [Deltaproteobacteria bacterium]|nr:MAG: hypothetical protein EP343_13295 [Deltaproteobacteria bacterium]